jgi:hypothetical protein
MPPHVYIDFVVPPPGCGRSVTDFWSWGAHRAQLHCPNDVSDFIYIHTHTHTHTHTHECEVPGGALNLNSTSYPDHGHYEHLPLHGKIPMAEPGIEPGTSCLEVRSLTTKPQGWSLASNIFRSKTGPTAYPRLYMVICFVDFCLTLQIL